MNVAKIHDRLNITTAWEKRINNSSQYKDTEEQRMQRSALNKLRDEWVVRLENRTKHLKSFNDNYLKKLKSAEQSS